MILFLSILSTIILRGTAVSKNPFLDIFKSTVLFFIYLQVSATLLLFLGLLTPLSSILVLAIPPLFSWKKQGNPLSIRDLVPFLPLVLLYLFFALPSPFLRDSLTYHLSLSKQYAEMGSFVQTDEVIFGSFPQGWQAILAIFHSVSSFEPLPFSPRLIAVFLTFGTAFGITGALLEQKTERLWAVIAGLMFLLIPTCLEFGTSCYVQSWLVLLSFYTVYSFLKAKSAFQIGLLVGLLCSLKYSSLFWALLFGLVYTYRKNSKFFLGAILTGFPFYLRNIILKENPIFPMGYGIFGGEGWDESRAFVYASTLQNYGMGREPLDYLLLPFRVFSTTELYQDFEGSLGFGLGILVLIALLSFKQLQKRERWLLYFGLGWAVLWAFQVQQIRFLMPVVPLFFVASVPLFSQRIPLAAPFLLLASLIGLISPFQQLILAQKPMLFFEEGSDVFLETQLPENYPVYQYLNAQETDKIWLVWMRGYHYYLEKPVRVDSVVEGFRLENVLFQYSDPRQAQQSLQKDNISHLAINWRFFLTDENADRLGDGATDMLKSRFSTFVAKGLFIPQKQFGPVWIYSISSASNFKDEK